MPVKNIDLSIIFIVETLVWEIRSDGVKLKLTIIDYLLGINLVEKLVMNHFWSLKQRHIQQIVIDETCHHKWIRKAIQRHGVTVQV